MQLLASQTSTGAAQALKLIDTAEPLAESLLRDFCAKELGARLRILRAVRLRALFLVYSPCFRFARCRGEAAVAKGRVSRKCVEERARRLRCWLNILRYVK